MQNYLEKYIYLFLYINKNTDITIICVIVNVMSKET